MKSFSEFIKELPTGSYCVEHGNRTNCRCYYILYKFLYGENK